MAPNDWVFVTSEFRSFTAFFLWRVLSKVQSDWIASRAIDHTSIHALELPSVLKVFPNSDLLFFFSLPRLPLVGSHCSLLSQSLALTTSLHWAVVRLILLIFNLLSCLVASMSEPVRPGVPGFFRGTSSPSEIGTSLNLCKKPYQLLQPKRAIGWMRWID